MAEFITFQPSDYYNTTIYSGDDGTQAITGVGFQPNFIWEAKRNATGNKYIFDSVRGVGGSAKQLETTTTAGESTQANMIQSFDADGYTQGSDMNASGTTYVSWSWKAETTTGIDTTGSTITPTSYSFNQTAGMSIIKYTGNNTSGALVPHGLAAKPGFIIVKVLSVDEWGVYHQGLNKGVDPEDWYIQLNQTSTGSTNTAYWNDTAPTSVLFTLGNSGVVNSVDDYIAYCFAEKNGYSKFGSYEGNGNADGPFVYTGFRPAFLLIKNMDTSATGWICYDDKRDGYNVDNAFTNINNNASSEGSNKDILLGANGFKPVVSDNDTNQSGKTYIYSAFAKFPIVSSNDVPGVAR